MRRLLFALAALLACGSAMADGSVIRWERFEGAHFQADDNGCVGGAASAVYICPGRPRSSGPGQAILNLGPGFLTFRVTGISNAAHYPNGVLGRPAASGGTFIGTVACHSTERYGVKEYVDTPPIWFLDGVDRSRASWPCPMAARSGRTRRRSWCGITTRARGATACTSLTGPGVRYARPTSKRSDSGRAPERCFCGRREPNVRLEGRKHRSRMATFRAAVLHLGSGLSGIHRCCRRGTKQGRKGPHLRTCTALR